MRKGFIAAIVPSAIILLGLTGYSIGQQILATNGPAGTDANLIRAGVISNNSWLVSSDQFYVDGNGRIQVRNPTPAGALFHQVVDVYYDADGNRLQTKSHTHVVNADCTPGRRLNQELIAQDDGNGNVKFTNLRLANEPATGVKPVTAEAKTKAMLAIRSVPATELTVTMAKGD